MTVCAAMNVAEGPAVGNGPAVGSAPSFIRVPEKVTMSPTWKGAANIAFGSVAGPPGAGIVKIVWYCPVVGSFGRFAFGQRGSSPWAGLTCGKHIGKPVWARMVGLSSSIVKRLSAENAGAKRPIGSLIFTRVPVVGSLIFPPTRSSPLA